MRPLLHPHLHHDDHHRAHLIAPVAILLAELAIILHLHMVALHLALAIGAFGRETYITLRGRRTDSPVQ
ncbi:hypothetical protein E1264_09175 [Actinomadura sp. KC216]|uniref:hypothetical protein n=1 Tax=Actinomadura sp. KC216 TaxID=2530370 RepID=UPI00104EB65F|nr:hypothetical protein [Actinomadura sp. KC216]TDB89132.1 hypothetical protein E1264_09175 [Actinomadura sp. KC216]